MVKSTSSIDLEPIDQLADKVRSLITVLEQTRVDLDQTRSELERTVEDNTQLSRSIDTLSSEVDSLQTQLASTHNEAESAKSLLEERDQIRTRVTEMLEQLEGLSL